MSRDMERERDCVGARENWTGLIIFRPDSFRLSQPGPRLHPGSLAVHQHLGPDHLPLRLSLPNFGFSPSPTPPRSLPPSQYLSLPLHLPPINPILTSDPRHPNLPLPLNHCTLFSFPTLFSTSLLSARACPLEPYPNRNPQRGSLAARAPIDRLFLPHETFGCHNKQPIGRQSRTYGLLLDRLIKYIFMVSAESRACITACVCVCVWVYACKLNCPRQEILTLLHVGG